MNISERRHLRGVTVYKVVAGESGTISSYNDECMAHDGSPERQDWRGLYTQFLREHVVGTIPYRWEKEDVSEARLLA